jgi:hypothetical protein
MDKDFLVAGTCSEYPAEQARSTGREQLKRLEILDQIALLVRIQVELEYLLVVVHDGVQVRKTAVVVEAALRTRK